MAVSVKAFLNSKNDKNNSDLKIKKFLNSNLALFLISATVSVFWALNLSFVSIMLLTFFEIFVFIYCKDNPVAFLLPAISISYMVTTYAGMINWIVYGICIFAFLVQVSIFIFRQIKVYKKKLKKGKMFWVFVLSAVGNMLAGIIGHFDLLNLVMVIVFSLLIYSIYWFCINFITDFKRYFAWALVFLGLIISAEMVVAYLRFENILVAILYKGVRVGTGEINAAAIFLLSGICATFYLGVREKRDYLYILLGLFLDVMLFLTYSRIALLTGAIVSIIYFFVILKNSPNRKAILIGAGTTLGIIALLLILFFKEFYNIVWYYVELAFDSNGRDILWPWCWEQFLASPFFGIGFATRDPYVLSGVIPGMGDMGGFCFINCHNIILHYLTCSGIIGLLFNLPFLIKKYKTVLTNFNQFKLFCLLSLLCIAIGGMFDPSPSNNIFNVNIIIFTLAFAENDDTVEKPKKIDKFLKPSKVKS